MSAAIVHRLILPSTVAIATIGAAADDTPITPDLPVPVVHAATPPKIDGVLDDAVWDSANAIEDLAQVEPIEGAPPSQATTIRLLVDNDNLYVGVWCHDTDPSGIITTTMARDASHGADDNVSFVIDTFLDRRNAYLFSINPSGSKLDALIEDSVRTRTDWDGIWVGRATMNDQGWAAEFAIPLKTVSFAPGGDQWGFNVSRVIRRNQEVVRWRAAQQNKSIRSMGDAGTIEGLGDLDGGAGIDVVPYGRLRWSDEDGDRDGWDAKAGGELFWRFSPSTTLAFTVNTDFAETEVDERQINLTRFPLFFPEKREFFLREAGIFNFGGIRRNPLPFNSRRIGIGPDRKEREILAGVRLTGRQGGVNYGLLNIQMKEDDELGRKNLAAGRVVLNVLEESNVGLIATAGDPTQRGTNYLVGSDFNYRSTTFNGSNILEGHAWVQQTWTDNDERDDSGNAYGLRLGYPNDRVDWELGAAHIDAEYDPALGFSSRRGIREYFGNWRYRWRPEGYFRTIDTGFRGFLVTNTDNDVESRDLSLQFLSLRNDAGDDLEFTVELDREVLDDSFEIQEGVTVPVGDYETERFEVEFDTSSSRPVSAGFTFSTGGFLSGDRVDTGGNVEWRVSPNLFFSAEYEQNDVDLPEGDFITRVARGRVNVYFTPDVSWTNYIQYDNVSDSIGVNSRIRWIMQPGNEVFLVLNQGLIVEDDGRLTTDVTEVTTKLKWTFRF